MQPETFLSEEWLTQVRLIKAEHLGTAVDEPGMVVNATITGVPFGNPTRELHSAHGPVVGWEPGHEPDATLSFTIDYALARELVLDTTFAVLTQATGTQQFFIDGDVEALRSWWTHRIGNPEAASLDDAVRAVTA